MKNIYERKFNPKKHNQDRRVRPEDLYWMPLTYKKVITKSRAGIKYIHFIIKKIRNPVGFNHNARRKLNAWARKHKYEPKQS